MAYVPATSSASYANESKKISLQKEKITVQSVFKWLEKTTEYSILLKEDQKLLSHTVALNLKNVSIEEAVATILKNTSYTFKISGGYITVVPQKKRKARKNTLNTTARKKAAKKKVKRQIKGVVKDVDGTPLIGVTVAEKNTTNGVNTNIDGEFSINVSSTQATLVFSYVGYRNLEINIGNQTFLEIVMRPNIKELEEVVVVAYGQKKKATVTGSISSIKADKLAEISTPSLTNMLAGSISGLSAVSVSGRPGADDAELYIRGVSSLNSKDPLVLVDGVERSWSQLDPNEIADLTVLKDASSTAVFGVRGANGVILITTKRGKTGKPVMNFSSSFGLQAWREKKEYLRAVDWMKSANERQINDGLDPTYTEEWLAKYDDPNRDMAMYPDKDVWDLYTRDIAPQYQHNFNVSGGTENIRYFVSLGYLDQHGMFAGYDLIPELDYDYRYQRFNYRANLDFDLTKTTTLQLNLGGRNKKTSRPNGSGDKDAIWREIENGSPISGAIIDGRLYRH
ncbi:MAG: SusC/RagA family TonB-linked outer membrane protein, partial [Cytophagales bacterium]|nr:SusC/RagA family TonB-linked outer membrane protein [Cytophagales bacterium]